ncbi:uncharacterized protein LOC121402912 [Xenopus laevis]|uniref:Uncharacterized protein LOC121402912 n=1 Tax=Xenopus laevis TaxID=8355 RepID=A0A8J1MVC8_XENLA|nr:uncharacterized protein LOC121402912 [Xenopus laevis]
MLEKKMFLASEYRHHILLYQRFVDDILVIWQGDVKLFQEMVEKANRSHPTIRFTTEIAKKKLHFLDIEMTIEEGGIVTNLFRKPTDRNNLLHTGSFHNPKCIKGIPKGQLLRARRIASKEEGYDKAARTLKGRFMEKGYAPYGLDKLIEEVKEIPREELLKAKESRVRQERIPFVSQFGKQSREIESIIKKYWPILSTDKALSNICKQAPMFCYKRGKSIKDKLCKAELETKCRMQTIFHSTPQVGTFPCLNCVCCSSVIKGKYISHPTKGYKVNMKHYATCNTSSVVYLLKCPCGKVYIGQTSRSVKERIKEHKGNIRNYTPNTSTDTAVSRHFAEYHHNVAQLRWLVVEVVKQQTRGGDRKKALLQREAVWIKKLDSMQPAGLNDQWSVKCFL